LRSIFFCGWLRSLFWELHVLFILQWIHNCHSEGGTTEESVQELKSICPFIRGHMLHKILRYAQNDKITSITLLGAPGKGLPMPNSCHSEGGTTEESLQEL